MPVPAKRRSSSKGKRNRAHQALTRVTLTSCPKCGKAVKPHKACLSCGTYKSREVIKIKSKVKKEKNK